MTRVRVEGFTISLDGYGAGPNQDIRNPLGVGGTDLHQWLIPTRTFQRTLFGADGGTTGIDDDFAARGFKNVGAWILGRNMFGPIRGSWPDMNWKGWWGDNPPYHVPTFILTHHARPPIQMEGGTTFYFVTGGIHEALDRARDAANGMDVRIGGGPNTIQQYLRAGLIDELHVAISPVLLGGGERLFEGIDVRALGYECVQFVASEKATHVVRAECIAPHACPERCRHHWEGARDVEGCRHHVHVARRLRRRPQRRRGRGVRLVLHLGGRRIPHRRVGPDDVQGVRAECRAPSRSRVRTWCHAHRSTHFRRRPWLGWQSRVGAGIRS